MKHVMSVLVMLGLAGCGLAASDDPFVAALQQARAGLFNRDQSTAAPFTATRASLAQAGITQPVLVVRMPDAGIEVGLIEFRVTRGVTIWRSLDGSTISTASGLLRNTRGFGHDLHSLETDALRAALDQGADAEYSRLYREIDGEGALVATRLYCQLSPEGNEQVDLLGRSFETQRVRESCFLDGQLTPLFENTYWLGRTGQIWKSRQWIGHELGYAELMRVER